MIVGRDLEKQAVEGLVTSACDGQASVLLLVGLPGIGKTSLLDHAEEAAAARGMSVWRLTAVEAESGISGSGLSLLGPVASDDRLMSPWGLLDVLATAAADNPLLLAVDDAHWLDEVSLTALGFACRRLQYDAVAVVMTARPEIDLRHELSGVGRIEVGPLTDDEASALLVHTSPGMPVDVARSIAASLGCVPLALVEAPALLPLDMLEGRTAVTSPLPVGRSITARYARGIDSLPEATRRALVIASASDSGSAATIAEALDLAGLSPGDLVPAHKEGLVLLDGGFRFRHPLVRSAVHAAARDSERRDAHLVLAAVASRQGDEDARLRHASEAALVPDEALAAGLEGRAPEVARRCGGAAAAAALERAAELSPVVADRWRRLVGSLELAGAAPASARHAHEVLEQCADPELRARAALVLADEHLPAAAAGLLLEDALRDLPRGEIADGLMVLRARLAMHQLDLPALDRIAEQLLSWEADQPLSWRCAGTVGEIATFRGRHREAREWMRRAVRDSATDDADSLPLYSLFDWVVVANHVGEECMNDPPTAVRRAAASRRFRATRDPIWMGLDEMLASEAARRAGNPTLAAVTARSALGYGPDTGGLRTALLSRLAQVLGSVGDEAGALAVADELDSYAELLDMPWEGLWSHYARGVLHLATGRADAAVVALARFDGIGYLGRGVRDAVATSLVILVEAFAASGRDSDALRVAGDLERWLDGSADPLAAAFVHRAHALAGTDDPDVRFTTSALHHRATDDPFELARTLLLHGEWLRRNRRPADSRIPLRESAVIFERLGAATWAARAHSELAATGETRAPLGGSTAAADLTPQELRIALAVAEGLSNNEIAAAVFLSVKTIETHLTRLYRKLGVRSRAGVAKALAEAGIAA